MEIFIPKPLDDLGKRQIQKDIPLNFREATFLKCENVEVTDMSYARIALRDCKGTNVIKKIQASKIWVSNTPLDSVEECAAAQMLFSGVTINKVEKCSACRLDYVDVEIEEYVENVGKGEIVFDGVFIKNKHLKAYDCKVTIDNTTIKEGPTMIKERSVGTISNSTIKNLQVGNKTSLTINNCVLKGVTSVSGGSTVTITNSSVKHLIVSGNSGAVIKNCSMLINAEALDESQLHISNTYIDIDLIIENKSKCVSIDNIVNQHAIARQSSSVRSERCIYRHVIFSDSFHDSSNGKYEDEEYTTSTFQKLKDVTKEFLESTDAKGRNHIHRGITGETVTVVGDEKCHLEISEHIVGEKVDLQTISRTELGRLITPQLSVEEIWELNKRFNSIPIVNSESVINTWSMRDKTNVLNLSDFGDAYYNGSPNITTISAELGGELSTRRASSVSATRVDRFDDKESSIVTSTNVGRMTTRMNGVVMAQFVGQGLIEEAGMVTANVCQNMIVGKALFVESALSNMNAYECISVVSIASQLTNQAVGSVQNIGSSITGANGQRSSEGFPADLVTCGNSGRPSDNQGFVHSTGTHLEVHHPVEILLTAPIITSRATAVVRDIAPLVLHITPLQITTGIHVDMLGVHTGGSGAAAAALADAGITLPDGITLPGD